MEPTYKVPAADDHKVDLLAESLRSNFAVRQNRTVAKAEYVDTLPSHVAVQPDPESRPVKCWFNVRNVVAKNGGRAIFGWAIWIRPDSHYQAIHHAVWERPDGQLIDVTPNEIDVTSIVFMADSRVPFDYVCFRAPASYVMHKNSTKESVQEFWTAPDGSTFTGYVLLRMEDDEEHASNPK
ncbi:hypothetical protein [Burkholderia sp. S171]|jgi:hypothetical protein|uniref:hypothetical protein n=1 Tax=Burkholderia sp. S171 TaxID=1641860 RepID=UPI00131E1BE0|nr:hypothetical protein [Burkholderia sp. S171]